MCVIKPKHCNRSEPRDHNVRSLKGTSKFNASCTAAIVVTQNEQNIHMQVSICTTHLAMKSAWVILEYQKETGTLLQPNYVMTDDAEQ